MKTQEEQDREAFERLATKLGMVIRLTKNGNYKHARCFWAWKAWQAALIYARTGK